MIDQLLRSRRSIRRFKPNKPARQQIEALIEMAALAPSASNKQPWRFFAADDRATIDCLTQAVRAAVARIGNCLEGVAADAFRSYQDNYLAFSEAPVVIVAAFREMALLSNFLESNARERDRQSIELMESQSNLIGASMAIQNLLLYAHATGLGATCMTGPLVAADEIKGILCIPPSWHIAALIPVGFPDETPPPTTRKPVRSILRWAAPRVEPNSRDFNDTECQAK